MFPEVNTEVRLQHRTRALNLRIFAYLKRNASIYRICKFLNSAILSSAKIRERRLCLGDLNVASERPFPCDNIHGKFLGEPSSDAFSQCLIQLPNNYNSLLSVRVI